jgi:glycerol-3-phosphate cytidylyltransferase/D-beta-D-heptose 7-phosphate kinase/D-beta-D-heptose 1-phosphate adenosyltransferase
MDSQTQLTDVIVSGYFNPLHIGHLCLLEAAAKLGDRLLVIVNNDAQQLTKKHRIIMTQDHRVQIVKSIKHVYDAVMSIDKDTSVRKTLEMIIKQNLQHEYIFANGGDRRCAADIPEVEVCEKHNVKMVFNVGGDKVDSSTNIIQKIRLQDDFVEKPWGSYEVLKTAEDYKVKILNVNPGAVLSLQYHKNRDEKWFILEGCGYATVNDIMFGISEYKTVYVPRLNQHKIENPYDSMLRILEIQTGICDEDDIVRLEDIYNRV